MKKYLVVLLLVMALAIPSAALAQVRIGVAMPTQSLQRWNQDGANMKMMLEAAGYVVDLQYANNDVALQVAQIENMILNGADILVISAIDGSSLGTVLAIAKEEGIPVIAYDRLIMETDAVSYYATFDNYKVGQLQGEYLVQALGLETLEGSVNMEIVAGSPDDNNARYFYQGAIDVLMPYIESGKVRVPSGQI
ncbi:MAG: substrate-binding domain-containing protein, partial [Bacillota bacterium]